MSEDEVLRRVGRVIGELVVFMLAITAAIVIPVIFILITG
jgi:hypothetical protein